MGPTPESKPSELRSWKEIAAYLERDVRTVIRWEKEKGLPVQRVPGPRGKVTVSADSAEIDRWLMGQTGEAAPTVETAGKTRTWRWPALALGMLFLLAVFGVTVAKIEGTSHKRLARPLRFATAEYRSAAPTGIAAGDFNGDGDIDLAVAQSGSNSILILYGGSSGSFVEGKTIPEGRIPERLAVGDFNRDGLADLVITNRGSGDVAVLLNDGMQGFRESFRWNSSGRSRWITVADLNHDGIPDLAVACSGASKIGVLLGVGDGTFDHIRTYDTDGEPSGVVAADFNLDGVDELAVSDYQIAGGKTVSLYQGNGDGTFRARTPFPTELGPLGIAAGDLNGDGRPDIATADYYDTVSVLLADNTGFSAHRRLEAGWANGFVAIGDFDNDGKPDLVVTGEHSDSADILFGNGRGDFKHAQRLSTGSYPDAIVVGDFDKDGKLDFAVANTQGNSVTIYLNRS